MTALFTERLETAMGRKNWPIANKRAREPDWCFAAASAPI